MLLPEVKGLIVLTASQEDFSFRLGPSLVIVGDSIFWTVTLFANEIMCERLYCKFFEQSLYLLESGEN